MFASADRLEVRTPVRTRAFETVLGLELDEGAITRAEYAQMLDAYHGGGPGWQGGLMDDTGYRASAGEDEEEAGAFAAPPQRPSLSTPSRAAMKAQRAVVVADRAAWAETFANGGRSLFAVGFDAKPGSLVRVATPERGRRLLPPSPMSWDEGEVADGADDASTTSVEGESESSDEYQFVGGASGSGPSLGGVTRMIALDSDSGTDEEDSEEAEQRGAYVSAGSDAYTAARASYASALLGGQVPFPRALRRGDEVYDFEASAEGDAAEEEEATAAAFVAASRARYAEQMAEIAQLEGEIGAMLAGQAGRARAEGARDAEAGAVQAAARAVFEEEERAHAERDLADVSRGVSGQMDEIASLERELRDAQATYDAQMREIAALEAAQAEQIARIRSMANATESEVAALRSDVAEEARDADARSYSSGSVAALEDYELGLKMAELERIDDEIDIALDGCERASAEGDETEVSVLLCTVTFYANLAHSLTRSP
jgi:hypothetical protein